MDKSKKDLSNKLTDKTRRTQKSSVGKKCSMGQNTNPSSKPNSRPIEENKTEVASNRRDQASQEDDNSPPTEPSAAAVTQFPRRNECEREGHKRSSKLAKKIYDYPKIMGKDVEEAIEICATLDQAREMGTPPHQEQDDYVEELVENPVYRVYGIQPSFKPSYNSHNSRSYGQGDSKVAGRKLPSSKS